MNYQVGELYYIAKGRGHLRDYVPNPNKLMGYGSLSRIDKCSNPEHEKYHFNAVVLTNGKPDHYQFCTGKDCLDAVNKHPVTPEERQYHDSLAETFAVLRQEFEKDRAKNKVEEPKKSAPLDLTAKIHNLIIDEMQSYEEKIKTLTSEKEQLIKENEELKDRIELIKDALKL